MELLNRKEKDFLHTWLSFKWIHQLLLCFTNTENVKSFEGSISPVCVLFYILAAALLVITVFFFSVPQGKSDDVTTSRSL